MKKFAVLSSSGVFKLLGLSEYGTAGNPKPAATFPTMRKPMRYPIPIVKAVEIVVGWEHVCPVCEKRFESKRKDALYCSPNCRQVAHRGQGKKKPRTKKRSAA